jgi:hypothetical protein
MFHSFKVSLTSYIALLSRGFVGVDISGIKVIHVAVDLFRGAANPLNGSAAAISRVEDKTKWGHGLYTCSSALKALIQRVTFSVNGTRFSDIKVLGRSPVLSSERPPLWAVEKSGRSINDAAPFWGVIDDRYENNEDIAISILRRSYLYLPAASSFPLSLLSQDSIAGSAAPQSALDAVYNEVLTKGSGSQFGSYTREQSITMYSQWRNLSRSIETAPKFIDLMWTDLMSNLDTGSKSAISSTNTRGQASISRYRLVRTHDRRIRYDL